MVASYLAVSLLKWQDSGTPGNSNATAEGKIMSSRKKSGPGMCLEQLTPYTESTNEETIILKGPQERGPAGRRFGSEKVEDFETNC